MITSPCGIAQSSETAVNGSSARANWPSASLIRVGIDGLLEGGDAGAPEGVEEALAVMALAKVDVDQGVHRVGHLVVGQRRAEHRADRGVLRARAAQGELVELLALL